MTTDKNIPARPDNLAAFFNVFLAGNMNVLPPLKWNSELHNSSLNHRGIREKLDSLAATLQWPHRAGAVGAASNSRTKRRGERPNVLPPSLPPRGLSRAEAAAYIGISATTFDLMVKDGRMPKAKRIGARAVWDRLQLDRAFMELPDAEVPGRNEMATDPADKWEDCSV